MYQPNIYWTLISSFLFLPFHIHLGNTLIAVLPKSAFLQLFVLKILLYSKIMEDPKELLLMWVTPINIYGMKSV